MAGVIIMLLFSALVILYCWQESKRRRIHFATAILWCVLLSPFIAFFIINSKPLRTAKTCEHCGNNQMETEYCGVCGKNEAGELK